jgi:metal-dependent amidase/aminoacylase/carboxypeptidase family protein
VNHRRQATLHVRGTTTEEVCTFHTRLKLIAALRGHNVVVAAARDEGLLTSGRIGIVLVPDEETAGPRGSRDLVARGVLGRDGIGMLTPEPTGGVVWNANRGAISLRATLRGKAAHVGRQFEGVNAFERALPAMVRLADIKKDVELRETQYNIAPPAARKSILLLGGRFEGGTNFNVTPDRRPSPSTAASTRKRTWKKKGSDCAMRSRVSRSRHFRTNGRPRLRREIRSPQFCRVT